MLKLEPFLVSRSFRLQAELTGAAIPPEGGNYTDEEKASELELQRETNLARRLELVRLIELHVGIDGVQQRVVVQAAREELLVAQVERPDGARVVTARDGVLIEQVQDRDADLERRLGHPNVLPQRQVSLAEHRRPAKVAAAEREE